MPLPPAAELIDQVRRLGPGALDRYGPEIDGLADIPALAAYLGIKPDSIYRERGKSRIRVTGDRPAWPEPEPLPGRSKLWRWRVVIEHRATMPGPGNRTARGASGE